MTMLIIILISFVLVIAIYGTRFKVLHITRFLTFFILGLMLINPGFRKKHTIKQTPVVVVDASESMSLSKKWESTQKILKELKKEDLKILYLVDTSLIDRVSSPKGMFTDLSIPLTRIKSPIILISDGFHNAGTDLYQSISMRKYPVNTIAPVTIIPKGRLKILNFELPGTVLENEKPRLKVTTNLLPKTVEVFIDGQMFRKLTPKNKFFEIRLPILSEGTHSLTLRVIGNENDVDEFNQEIESISPKLKVQILANKVSPLLGYLRRYFSSIAKLDIWVRVKPKEWRLLGEKKVLIGQPKKQSGVTILLNPNRNQIIQYADNPKLIFLGKQSSILQLEGVKITPIPQTGYLATNNLTKKFPTIKNIWITHTTDSSVVILKSSLKGGGTAPLLYVIPSRKMAICTTTELWKIALVEPDFVDSVFEKTLDILLSPQVYFNVSMKKSNFVVNEPITVSTRLLDYRGRRIIGGWVRGITDKDTIYFVEMENGNFVSQPFTLPQGTHEIVVEYGQNQKPLGKKSIGVSVSTENIEMLNVDVDSLLLSELALKTGGTLIKHDQLGDLNNLVYIKTELKVVSPFRTIWALLSLVVILVIEWIARQRRGLL